MSGRQKADNGRKFRGQASRVHASSVRRPFKKPRKAGAEQVLSVNAREEPQPKRAKPKAKPRWTYEPAVSTASPYWDVLAVDAVLQTAEIAEEEHMDLPSDGLTAPSTAERGYPLFVPESEAPPAESPLPSEQPQAESPLPQFDAYETLLSASSYSDEGFGRPRRKRREDGTKEPWPAVDVPDVESSEDDNIPIAQVTSISRNVHLFHAM